MTKIFPWIIRVTVICLVLSLLIAVVPRSIRASSTDWYSTISDNPGNHYGKNTPTPIPTYIVLTATPTPLVTVSITPTPRPLPHGKKAFFTRGSAMTPAVTGGYIDPFDPQIGFPQSVNVSVSDPTPVVSVDAVVTTDTQSSQYPLSMISGTQTDGTWLGSWTMDDSYTCVYLITIVAADESGNTSETVMTLR